MDDLVLIEGLAIDTVIGIHDFEREIQQTVILDLEMHHDNRPAAESEDISLTLDYFAISQRLIEFVGSSEFLLIETLAERCAELLLAEFTLLALRIKVSKPGAVPEARNVAVQIFRRASHG